MVSITLLNDRIHAYPNVLSKGEDTLRFLIESGKKYSKCKIIASFELNEKDNQYVPLDSRRACKIPKEVLDDERNFFRLSLVISNKGQLTETNEIIIIKEV